MKLVLTLWTPPIGFQDNALRTAPLDHPYFLCSHSSINSRQEHLFGWGVDARGQEEQASGLFVSLVGMGGRILPPTIINLTVVSPNTGKDLRYWSKKKSHCNIELLPEFIWQLHLALQGYIQNNHLSKREHQVKRKTQLVSTITMIPDVAKTGDIQHTMPGWLSQ